MRVPELERAGPHADAVQRWLMSWVRRCGLPLDGNRQRRLERARFARYVALMFPGADAADLRVLAGLVTWFFLLDDACDGDDPRPERLRPFLAGVVECLRNPGSGSEEFAGPMHTMLRDVWQVPYDRMPAVWRDRFVMHVRDYLDGVLVEAANKAAGWRPGVSAYVRLRRATSGVYVCQTLTEFAARAVVPDPIYHHPAVRAYSDAGNDLLSWFNDLISLDDDRRRAGGHNLVLALASERRLSLPRAVEEAVALWERTAHGLTALRGRVPSFGPAMDPALGRYLDGVATAVRATVAWSAGSGRYPGGVPAVLRTWAERV